MAHHWLILFITESAEAAMWCPQGDHSSISPATLVVSHWGLRPHKAATSTWIAGSKGLVLRPAYSRYSIKSSSISSMYQLC